MRWNILDEELQVRDVGAVDFVGLLDLEATQEGAIWGFFNGD